MLLSLCAYAQLPQEGFETWPVGAGGWERYQNSVGTSGQWSQGTAANPGFNSPNSAFIASQNVPPPGQPIDYLVTKTFVVPALPKLTFMSRFIAGGDQGNLMDILIAETTGNGDPANTAYTSIIGPNGTNESEMNLQQQVWTAKQYNIPNTYVNKTVRIAFVYKSVNSSERWLIDNVQVDTDCLAPNFTITNATTGSLKVNITANPSNATNFAMEVVTGTEQPDGSVDYTFSGTSYVIPGLNPDTDYRIYVWALCSPTNPSTFSGPITGSTRPIGITCAEPIVVTQTPFQTSNNTLDFGDDIEGNPGAGCNATGTNFLNGNEVFYAYTPTITGNVSIVMTNNGPASGMFVYADCNAVGNNCIAGGIGNATTPVNIPSLAVTAGTTYFIVISSSTVQTTPYTLTIQQVGCAQPTGLQATNVGSGTADFSWTENGTATEWQVVTQPAGTGLPTAGSTIEIATTNNNWPKSGMDQATAYEYYVRSNCGNGTYSAWSGPITFTTTQIPGTLTYTQDFEGASHNFTLNNGSQTNKWVVGNAANNTTGGSKSLYISNDNGTTNAYTITTTSTVQAYRDIAVPADAQQINIAFDWRAFGQGTTVDYVRVWSVPTTYNPTAGVLTNATNSGGGFLVGTYNLQNTWQSASVTLNPTTGFVPGQSRRILFEWRNDGSTGTQPPAAIDNINISVVTCSVPSAITLQNVGPNNANLSWTAAPFAAQSYDYYYSTSNTPPTATTPEMGNSTTTTASLINLDDSTVYYFWVRSDCDTNGNSFWVGPFSFMTPQIPATLEYNEDYEGVIKWSLLNGTQTNKWVVGTATANGGTHSLYVTNAAGTTNANAYTVGSASTVHAYRDFTVPANASQVDVAFDWKAAGEGTVDYVRAWIVPVTFNPTPGTLITAATGANARTNISGTLNQKTNWTNFAYVWNNPAAGTYRLVLEWRNDGSGGTQPPAAVDNVNLKVVTCPKPTNLVAANPTQTTVELTWNETGTATNWEVYTVPTGSPFPTAATMGSPTNDNTQFVHGPLQPGTVYDAYVRAACSGSDKSRWIGPVKFQTECTAFPVTFTEGFNSSSTSELCWTVLNLNNDADTWDMNYTTNPYEGNQVAVINTDGNGTGANANNDWLITPQILLTGNQRLRFRYRVQSANEPNRFEVKLSTTGKNPADFTTTVVPAANYSNTTYAVSTTTLTNGSGNISGPVYIGFHVPGGGPDGWRLYIDQVVVENLPCNPEVTNIETSCVSTTGANVSWTPGAAETSWEVAVVPNTAPVPTSGTIVTTPSFTAQNLTAETGYTVYVRPICSNGQPGNWETVGFVTPETSVLDAEPFCAATNGQFILFDNVDDSDNAQEYGDIACLGSTPNPVWYYLQIDQPGNLNFQILQNTVFNGTGNPTGQNLDVDFVAWGPFTSTTQACEQIDMVTCPTCPNNTAANGPAFYPFGNIVDCSYDASFVETLTIDNAQQGQIYVLLITNFNGAAGKIKLTQLPGSTGNTNCNILYSVDLGPDKYLCGQNSTTLTATVTSPGNSQAPTYQWFRDTQPFNPPVVSTTPLSQTVTVNDLGSHVYSVVVTVPNAANTTPITDQVTVVLGPNVTVPNPTGITVCSPTGTATVDFAPQVATILGALNPADYTVEFYPTQLDATNGTTTPIDITQPFVTGTTTLYVRVESTLLPACFSTVPFPITVNTNPTATISYGTTPFCFNAASAAVTLTGSTGGGYTAAPVTGGTGTLVIDPVTGAINVAASNPGQYTITYLIAATSSCPEFSTTTTVTILPEVNVPATFPVSVCSNTTTADLNLTDYNALVLNGLNPADYVVEYYTSLIDATSGIATPIDTSVPYQTGDVTLYVRVEAVASGICFDVAELVISISTAPNAAISYTGTPACADASPLAVTQTGTVGGSYTASPVSGTGTLAINATTGEINVAGSTAGTYTVTYGFAQSPTCPAFTTTTTVTILPAFSVPATVPVSVCSNNGTANLNLTDYNAAVLNTLNPADYVVEYYTSLADANSGTATPIDTTIPYATTGTTLYVRVEAVASGVCFDVAEMVISVSTVPNATISYAASPVCSDATAALTVTRTGTVGGSYSASPVSGTGALAINPTTGEINVAGSTPGTYTVTYGFTQTPTCPAFSTTATVVITPRPVAAFTYDAATYCQNAGAITATLGNGATAGVFSVDLPGLSINTATGAINPQASTPGTYIVTNTIAAANGCSQVAYPVTITINLAPVATFHYMPDSYCTNGGTASPMLDGISGTFSATPAGLVINQSTGIVDLANSQPGTYVVTNAIAATPTCPGYGETASITIVAVPELTYSQGCEGNDYILEVLFDGDENYTADDVDIVWTNSAGNIVGTDAAVKVTVKDTYTVKVTPIAGVACPVSIPLTPNDVSCMIQKGISPNGDGLNDTFDLTALNVTKLSIFNRYGKEVYSYGAYTNQWHGQSSGGAELPTGTYFYMIERVTGENSTGWIYINREE